MRCAWRNKRKFWFANYVDRMPVLIEDEWGNRIQSGEYVTGYKTLTPCKANISPATGEVEREMFGTSEGYDKLITLDNPDTPITENTVLWIDRMPEDEKNPEKGVVCGGVRVTKYDYIVRRVSRYLHGAVIAVSKVTQNG